MNTHASDLAEFASDAAFAIDADASIVAWNAPAQRLLGYAPSEVIGRHCGKVLQATLQGGEPLCHPDCNVIQCFRDCRSYGVPNCRVKRRDGEWIPASIASVAMSEQARRLSGRKCYGCHFHPGRRRSRAPVPHHHTLQLFALGGFGVVVAGRNIDIEQVEAQTGRDPVEIPDHADSTDLYIVSVCSIACGRM